MREELVFSDCAGQTIEGVFYSGWNSQAVVTFTDGTFATIGTDTWYDDTYLEDGKLDVLEFGDTSLIEAGIITAEELKAKRMEGHERYLRRQEASEREYYERLKKKYETG